MRHLEPRRRSNGAEIHRAPVENHRSDVAGSRTENDRDQFHDTLAEDGADDCHSEGNQGKDPVLRGHIDTGPRKGETDEHDDRREKLFDEAGPEQFDKKTHQKVDDAHCDKTAEHPRHPIEFGSLDDRSDERETAAKIDRHLSFGDQMEKQGTETSSEQGDSGIEAYQQRDQDRRPEGHKHELGTHYGASQRGKSLFCHGLF